MGATGGIAKLYDDSVRSRVVIRKCTRLNRTRLASAAEAAIAAVAVNIFESLARNVAEHVAARGVDFHPLDLGSVGGTIIKEELTDLAHELY